MKKHSIAFSLLAAIALLMGSVAIYEWLVIQRQTKVARVDRLVAESVSARDNKFDLSLLLSVEAFHLVDTAQTRGLLLDNVQANPQLIRYLGSDIGVSAVTFSPDGKILAAGREDGAIVIWNIATGTPTRKLVATWTPPPGLLAVQGGYTLGPVSDMLFTPDGEVLIACIYTMLGDQRIIGMWNLATGRPITYPSLQNKSPQDLVLSPDGRTLAISEYGDVSFWDMEREQFVGQFSLELFEGAPVGLNAFPVIYSPVFSPDGKTFAAISSVNTITFWDVTTLQPVGQPLMVGEMYVENGIENIAFTKDGKSLLAAYPDGTLTAWSLSTRQPQALWRPPQIQDSWMLSGYGAVFSPGGSLMASSDRGAIHVLDTQTGREISEPLRGNSSRYGDMVFSPDGSMLASTGDYGVLLWDLTGRQLFGQTIAPQIQAVGFSPTGRVLAVGWLPWPIGSIAFWDSKTQQLGEPLNHGFFPISSAFSPDGKRFAAGDNNGKVVDWDTETQKVLGQLDFGSNAYISSLVFSPDGAMVAIAVQDPKVGVVLWDGTSPKVRGRVLHTTAYGTRSLAFSPDGKRLAVGSGADAGSIVMWNVESGSFLTWKSTFGSADGVAFSPDGKKLAATSRDGKILLWDVASRQLLGQPFILRSGGIPQAIAFSPDGKMLVSGNYDDTINIWDVATRETIGQGLLGNPWPVGQVAFSPDGHTLATASNRAILWDMNPQSWAYKICERVGRNFTRAEWSQYFPGETYRITCSEWPAEAEPTVTPTNTP